MFLILLMKVYTLERKQIVSKKLSEVFPFFAKPENLEELTPPSLNFKIITPTPIEMKEGALIDYTIKISGIPQRWTTLITKFEPPHKFVDQQIKGPYSFWHHTHEFYESKEGTVLLDRVDYGLPFSFLGDIAHALFVKKQLNTIFDYRYQIIQKLFNS